MSQKLNQLIFVIMCSDFIRKPFKVEFLDGPYNGAVRYYSTLSAARIASHRYVYSPISGRSIFTHPACEIYFISTHGSKFLEVIY